MEKFNNFSSACGSTGRIVAARILPNSDILETIGEICKKNNINYGQITTTVGSLRRISLNYVSRTTPIADLGHTTHIEKEGPFSVLAGQGLVSPSDVPNKMNIHLHMAISGENDVVYGGHIEEGTITLSTLDIFILEVKNIEIKRKKDPNTGIIFTSFESV